MRPLTPADRRRAETSSCQGKVRFTSAHLATAVAKRRNARNNGVIGHAYHCRFCGGYHIGRPNNDADTGAGVRRRAFRERVRQEADDMEDA